MDDNLVPDEEKMEAALKSAEVEINKEIAKKSKAVRKKKKTATKKKATTKK
jgi:hypothetical protein